MASSKKNSARRNAWIVFEDESGFSLNPSVRATWAPRGKTPVLRHHLNNWKRISMAAGVCVRPDGTDAQLAFSFRPGSYNDEALMEFVLQMREHLGGAKVTLIWDGLPSHRSRAMRRFVNEHRRWLVVEPLPPYAYDLNPVEQVWGNLKGTELVNLCPETIAEASGHVERGLNRIASEARLCLSFVRHCGLRL